MLATPKLYNPDRRETTEVTRTIAWEQVQQTLTFIQEDLDKIEKQKKALKVLISQQNEFYSTYFQMQGRNMECWVIQPLIDEYEEKIRTVSADIARLETSVKDQKRWVRTLKKNYAESVAIEQYHDAHDAKTYTVQCPFKSKYMRSAWRQGLEYCFQKWGCIKWDY